MLATLFAGDFDRYFSEAAGGNPLWMFVHVPKTAGSSMEAEMSSILKPNGHIEIDYTDTSKTYQVLFDEAVQRFVARHQADPYKFATGHIVARHTDMLRTAIPELRCFSMLRSPVARIISDYRYQRSSMNTARENFVRVTPDFATYVARKHVHNKTAKALVPLPLVEAGDIEAAVEFILKNFVFIGLQEMYPLSLRAITTLAGQSRSPEAKVRVNNESDDNRVELTPKEEADLRRLNAVDVGIYNAFLERWRPIRDDLRTYLTTHPRVKAA